MIFKNYPNEKITVTDEITPDDYIYEESKNIRDWKLINDTLNVCGYLCYKAVTSFGGREWTVWYAPEIAIADGPWKLYGLPGLILKASDSTGTHSFEAAVLRQSLRPIYMSKNILQIKIKKEQFIINKNAFEKDPQKSLMMSSQIKSITVLKKSETFIINGKRATLDPKRIYCPTRI